jgi:hypothetical protein
MVRTGATVADARADYLRYIEQDRQGKPSTPRDYDSIFRDHVLPHLGAIRLEDLTPERVERWAARDLDPHRQLANRTREKSIMVFHGVMERARKLYRLPSNLVADVEKRRRSCSSIALVAPAAPSPLLMPRWRSCGHARLARVHSPLGSELRVFRWSPRSLERL